MITFFSKHTSLRHLINFILENCDIKTLVFVCNGSRMFYYLKNKTLTTFPYIIKPPCCMYLHLDEAKGNEAVKKSIREKCVGYIDRAEEIKKFLDKKSASKSTSKSDNKKKANKAEGS